MADHHLLMNVDIVRPDGLHLTVEMVIDTGYVGTLTLPSATIELAGIPFARTMPVQLADGSTIDVDVHIASILWHEKETLTEIILLEDRPLLGMLLLDGSEMIVHFKDGGILDISDLE